MRLAASLLFVIILVVAGAYIAAGRAAGPAIDIRRPAPLMGATAQLELAVQAPGGTLTRLDVFFEQEGTRTQVGSLSDRAVTLSQEAEDRVRLTRELDRRAVPSLKAGRGRVVVVAGRSVLYGLRTVESTATRDLTVRLEPPRVAVVSAHHYVNHAGAEMVVYRVTPPDVQSGVRVGDVEYPGYPASGAAPLAGVTLSDPSLRVAFFALLHDQDVNTPIHLYARDEASNSARADFDYRRFPKPFRRSRIDLDDRFLSHVVPAILERTPDFKPEGDVMAKYLAINGELRRRNTDAIAKLASQTDSKALWMGPFQQLGNTQVEAAFADHRTYFYQGREVDQQVHLGFDLASTANAPVLAANRGRVIYTDYLGIYGNCVIVDHGLGVQSLYGHLSSFETAAGQTVEKGQTLGRSGMTGLAGGDHVHFTVLLHGRPVNPVEWWDPHWMDDRVLRKLREASKL
jgi:hypothetical protein